MPFPVARPARPEDHHDVERLLLAAEAEIRPLRGGVELIEDHRNTIVSVLTAVFQRAAGLESGVVLVGALDTGSVSTTVGVLIASIDAQRGTVLALFVEGEARQLGVGEALLGAFVARCEAGGCIGIDADALPGARATKNFFETSGLTARRLVVHRALKRAGAPDPGSEADAAQR